jgi:hypothetical protein
MSVKVLQNALAPLVVSNFFGTAVEQPITIAMYAKQSEVPTSGLAAASVVMIGGPADNYYSLEIGYGSGIQFVQAAEKGTGSGGNNSMNVDRVAEWVPAISTSLGTSDTKLYSTDALGAELSSASGNTRSKAAPTDLRLFPAAWGYSDLYVSHVFIYRGSLTPAERQEFYDSGSVSGLTPDAAFDMSIDWATTGGQILDLSGNDRHITPVAGWTYSADNPTLTAAVDYTQRKGSTFDGVTHTLGTITTATLNGVTVFDHVSSQAAGTISFTGAITDEITTSGVVDLVLGDGTSTETYTMQVNVYGVVPSNNPAQKDGAALASLTGVQVRITNGTSLNGVQRFYSATEATDASGNFATYDVSSSVAAAADPVLMQVLTAAGDSITSTETVGLI